MQDMPNSLGPGRRWSLMPGLYRQRLCPRSAELLLGCIRILKGWHALCFRCIKRAHTCQSLQAKVSSFQHARSKRPKNLTV